MTQAEWQPIDTAPKDGSQILVFGHPKAMKVRHPNVADAVMVGWWDGEQWVVDRSRRPYETAMVFYWMPLPPPPALIAGDGGAHDGS